MQSTIPFGKHVCEHSAIDGSRFFGVSMIGNTFDQVNLLDSTFNMTNFTNVHFDYVNMKNCEFKNGNYLGAKIEGILITDLIEVYHSVHPKLPYSSEV